MASNFPTSLDTLTNPSAGSSTTTVSHASQHANANDAIEALQAKVGIDSSSNADSLDYKMANHTHLLAGITDITATATELNYVDGVTSAIQTQLDTKALDSAVVHNTGTETIAGAKTFSSDVVVPEEAYSASWNGSLEVPTKNAVYDKIEAVQLGQVDWGDIIGTLSDQTDLQTALDGKVATTGDETIAGVKTFSSSPIVPAPTTDLQTATKKYVDDNAGKILYDILVDASGDGDYTTLGGAIAVATAGQTIFVRSGTYAESAITTTLANLTIIGENSNTTILAFSSTDGITSSGGGLTLANLSITLVNGKLDISGNSNKIVDCEFSHSGTVTDYVIQVAGANGIFSRNRYTDGSADTVSARLQWHSSNGLITNNVFKIRSTTTDGGIYIPDTLGDNTTFSGNVIERIFDTSTAGYLVRVAAKECTISANNFSTNSERTQSTLLRVQGQWNVVTGNNFSHGNYAISSTCQNGTTITGNHIQGCTYGIEVVHNYHTVTGNTIRGRGAGSSWGIKADGVSYGSIVGNRIHNFTTSIELASGTTNFVVVGNEVSTVSTNAILNNGLRNTVFNNLGENETAATVHKRMKNVSGGTLTVGSVVVLNSVANSDEVTTTTTAGSNKVYGVVAETSLANATYGLIQTKGKTVSLKVNGTTDIAIGDYLSTFTTAGIAKKASAGDTVFAVALEAYATDDSSGVIDALLIEPRIAEVAGTWGSITGTLSDQTDLQSALDAKGDMNDLVDDTTPQLGGNLDLNQFNIQLDATPDVDHTASGIITAFTAGEALVYGDICYINSSGNMVKADADAIATGYGVAMALGTISSSATGNFLMSGFARDDTWAWTVGSPIYLSTTAGAMTQTAPSGTDDVVQVLGIATHADRMWFNPQLTVVEVA